MAIELNACVKEDGCIALEWRVGDRPHGVHLLILRTGSVPAYTSLKLRGDTTRYQINHLSRHQRYLVAVLAPGSRGPEVSGWVSVTPRQGLQPKPAEQEAGFDTHLARVSRFLVMPQDGRLTAFWEISRGFVDQLVLELSEAGRMVKAFILEPEVTSLALDSGRGASLQNGRDYTVRLRTRFAGLLQPGSPEVLVTPAPQGQERQANRAHPQDHFLYPTLVLSPEVQVFPEDGAGEGQATAPAEIRCGHCRQPVRWEKYRLRCNSCGAEYIPNSRGDFLEVGRLRFGTCQCCLPRKILVQKAGTTSLVCAHSGKEHIRMPDSRTFHLIEDLPFGLCQCCRPRRPLVKKGETIRCSKSGEKHQNQGGMYLLVPSEPVFDAAAIDDLLDAGLAEICSTGVSRGRR